MIIEWTYGAVYQHQNYPGFNSSIATYSTTAFIPPPVIAQGRKDQSWILAHRALRLR